MELYFHIHLVLVSAHPGSTSHPSSSSSASQPWVLISTSPSSKAMVAVSGNEVLLSCPLLSSGNPKVQWILPDGARLISPASSTDDMVQATASGLRLRKVQLSNAGLYYCVAQAGKDVDVLPMRLAVEESSLPPSGEDMGPPVTGIIRKAISLSCKASGSPEPHIGWVLPDGNIIRPGLTVSGGLTLQGVYRCVASNLAGAASASVRVHVSSLPPVIHQAKEENYHIIKVRQGATAAIHCRATGEPAPTVTWFSPANRVIPRSSGSGHYSERVVVISNGILEVRQAQRFDTGNYTCRASNSAGGRSMVVGLEVEPPNHGMSGPVRGRGTISGGFQSCAFVTTQTTWTVGGLFNVSGGAHLTCGTVLVDQY
uniref:Ig-like domain-containing protein n=1 Tax=Echeneis naucrates TaxID=173247 RepID=A0A665XA30_ECHNA